MAVNTQHPADFEHSLLQESKDRLWESPRPRADLSQQEQVMPVSWYNTSASADPGPKYSLMVASASLDSILLSSEC